MELLKFNMKDALSVKEYILAGKSIFTLKSETTGVHKTYKVVESRKPNLYFVYILTNGSDGYSYIGTIWSISMDYTIGKDVRLSADSVGVKAIEFICSELKNKRIHPKLKILPSKFCCKCGRTLTTPESLKAGIGPECSKRLKQKIR